MEDEIEQILLVFVEAGKIEPEFDEVDYDCAIKNLTNLIHKACNQSRIDELKMAINRMDTNKNDYTDTYYYLAERHEQLTED